MKGRQELEWMLSQRRREWLEEGKSAAPLLELLIETDRAEEAATMARLALRMEPVLDRERITAILGEIESTPEGWNEALVHFATKPSRESWEPIIRFSGDRAYDWSERAVRELIEMGCDADAIILHASQTGITPGMIGLIEDGLVSVDALLERASHTKAARAVWLGFAAQAAYLGGDRFRAISLLREGMSCGSGLASAAGTVLWLRHEADPEMEELMRQAGVWDLPSF